VGEVVNLGRVRKAKVRAEAAQTAAANRAKFGRTKAEKMAECDAAARAERMLDGAKREE